jgi:hypothetical protein
VRALRVAAFTPVLPKYVGAPDPKVRFTNFFITVSRGMLTAIEGVVMVDTIVTILVAQQTPTDTIFAYDQ